MVKHVPQTIESTSGQLWTDGSSGKIYSVDIWYSGLQAYRKGSYYGDADYNDSPTTSGDVNDIDNSMNIQFALYDFTFQWATRSLVHKLKQEW